MKIETILVPIDFSKNSAKALDAAAGLAERFKARLVLLHAHHIDVPMTSQLIPGGPVLPADFQQQMHERATGAVEALAQQASKWGVEVTGKAVVGPASQAIVDEAEALSADLIVMGTRGNTGVKHVLLGSVAERVVRTAPCPVLTVKAGGGKDEPEASSA